MPSHSLGLSTSCSIEEVRNLLLHSLDVTCLQEVSQRFPALEVLLRDKQEITRLAQEDYTELLGSAATAEVRYLVDTKTDWDEARQAQIAMAVSAASLASEAEAVAILLFQRDGLIMRRTDGTLYLYERFSIWNDPFVIARLSGSWVLTDDQDVGVPEGAIPFR